MSKSEEAMHGITFKDKIGYAMGDMGGLLTFGLVSAFLNMFYTDVLGISAARITVLMIVARIWDAVNDPMWGSFIDSRKPTKYGRFRPYILWASLPLAVGAFFMFFKIPGLSDNRYLIYAYITYIFYGMMYTGVNIPYGSLASVLRHEDLEGTDAAPQRLLVPLPGFHRAPGDPGHGVRDTVSGCCGADAPHPLRCRLHTSGTSYGR